MIAWLRELRYTLQNFFQTFGQCQLFLVKLLWYTPRGLMRPRLIAHQIFSVGAISVVLIMVSGLFVGMVLGLQGYDSLSRYGATESIGTISVLSLVRELGPVVTALLFAGRAGTALASEIGLMRATEQLSGMEMMAVDPVRRVVVPRFLAGVISMPLLAGIFSAIGVLGAYLVAVKLMKVDEGAFWAPMHQSVEVWSDVMGGVLKSLVFGGAASLIAVFEGYNAFPTAEGVSRATTRTVVLTALSVLILDYMLTAVML
jgi:phospholipid/cholesterol/gamma-HCH transport system permease protein